jgi:hypothetical protein
LLCRGRRSRPSTRAGRVVADDALVTFETNRYSVPPGYAAQTVVVRAGLGDVHLEIYSQAGRRIARHRAGRSRRVHRAQGVRRKPNRPPGARGLADAARFRVQDTELAAVCAPGSSLFTAIFSMELAGLEPATSWVRSRRSPN